MSRILKYILYILSILTILHFLVEYWDYYTLAYSQRPRHPEYKHLKPGGNFSHGLGIIGTSMLILLLLYSLRKRVKHFSNLGTMSGWLDIHIFFGSIGPIFIILHSTFKFNGIVSVSFWSMILVALSGVLGRYLYQQIPRTIRGNELNRDEVKRQIESLVIGLHQDYKIKNGIIKKLDVIIERRKSTSFISLFLNDILRLLSWPFVKRKLIKQIDLPKSEAVKLIKILLQKVLLKRRLYLWDKVHKIFHLWHVLHKPFALIMYVIMLVHICVAVWLGYSWIL